MPLNGISNCYRYACCHVDNWCASYINLLFLSARQLLAHRNYTHLRADGTIYWRYSYEQQLTGNLYAAFFRYLNVDLRWWCYMDIHTENVYKYFKIRKQRGITKR